MAEEDVTDWLRELLSSNGATMQKLHESSNGKNVMLPWYDRLEVVEASRKGKQYARAKFRFDVQNIYLNPGETLQGGLQVAMFDVCTSWLALLVADWENERWTTGGVSRNLNTTYLRPALEGEVLIMNCETVHVGKRLMKTRADLRRERDDALISTCEHDKVDNARPNSSI